MSNVEGVEDQNEPPRAPKPRRWIVLLIAPVLVMALPLSFDINIQLGRSSFISFETQGVLIASLILMAFGAIFSLRPFYVRDPEIIGGGLIFVMFYLFGAILMALKGANVFWYGPPLVLCILEPLVVLCGRWLALAAQRKILQRSLKG